MFTKSFRISCYFCFTHTFSESFATFSIPRPRKTQRLGPLRSLSLPRFSGPSCPLNCLAVYVDYTAALRQKDSDALFICLKRPHKEVGSSTIARWIKQGLISAGINNDFGAHSTRGSASSKAAQAGVLVDQILKAANWKSDSVFKNFYFHLVPTKLRNAYSHNQHLIFKITVKGRADIKNIIKD